MIDGAFHPEDQSGFAGKIEIPPRQRDIGIIQFGFSDLKIGP